MKTLSITGIVLSCVMIVLSFSIMNISCYDEWGTDHPGLGSGLISFCISGFFLAFSITACVSAFRKKKA